MAGRRACRIGERMVVAFGAGDFQAADDEVGRLADLDGADVRFDVDAIADVVDDAQRDDLDDLVELLADGGCVIDAPDDDERPYTTSIVSTTEIPHFTIPIPTSTNVPPTTGYDGAYHR